eukprot:602573-Rhodomonas_salina.2
MRRRKRKEGDQEGEREEAEADEGSGRGEKKDNGPKQVDEQGIMNVATVLSLLPPFLPFFLSSLSL